MPTLLSGINKNLDSAIRSFIDNVKKLERGYSVNIVDFHKESVVQFSGIDSRAFMLDEVWSVDNFNLKVVKIVDLDGECFLRLKAIV